MQQLSDSFLEQSSDFIAMGYVEGGVSGPVSWMTSPRRSLTSHMPTPTSNAGYVDAQ
jgi:hypothetical protein